MAYFRKKTWKDRLVEFAGRRTLKNVGTNESVTYDVTRAEGTVSQEGDAFSPANMNDMEQRIADGFSAAEAANNQLSSELAKSKKWTLLNVAADLEITQEMINTYEEFLITVVSNDTVLGNIILPSWHSIFQTDEYIGKYLYLGGWYHNAENCGMIQIYKFRNFGWTTNPALYCCSINGQFVTVNIALFGR